jgi:predicted TIM-barrel fold metal-dependent hydrolase
MRPVGETEFVQGLTAESARRGNPGVAAGIVSWADLTLGDAVVPVLEAHIEAGKGRFKGIRQTFAWTGDPNARGYHAPRGEMAADKDLRRGLQFLKKYNLTFETIMLYTQLKELVDLARALPDIPIILNHLAGPRTAGVSAEKRYEVFQEWQQGMAILATCQNVIVKLGGFGMGLVGFDWKNRPAPAGSEELAKAAAPWVLWCIEKFGTNRCMFESNFPVDRQSFSYNVIWNAFKRITSDFSPNERRALFHDTAVNVYRL